MATIADYIGKSGKFRVAFWTSYSIDFSTANFLTRSHLLPIIDRGHCHFLVDAHQLDETCKDAGKLRFFRSLQSVASISASHYKGTFHPKILLLVGETEIRLVLTSGNTTEGGVLANADLIARFDFGPDSSTDRSSKIIAAAFQYLRALAGWNEAARSHFTSAVVAHPWLDATSESDFYFSPQNESLFDRIIAKVGKDVDGIEIYSPFFDTDFAVPRKLRSQYPKVPITCWSGRTEIEVLNLNILDELKKERIEVRGPAELNKKQFHAKLFRFRCGKQSLYFWGSANATRAALLFSDLNAEFLVCEQTENSNFDIFLSKGSKSSLALVLRDESQVKEEVPSWPTVITSAEIENQQLRLTLLDGIEGSSFQVRLHYPNESLAVSGTAGDRIISVDLRSVSMQILAVDIVNESGIPMSNRIPVCDREKLDACAGLSPSINVQSSIDNSDIHSLKGELESLFSFELRETMEPGTKSGSPSAATDFWTNGHGKNRSMALWREARTLVEQHESIQSALEESVVPTDEEGVDEPTPFETVAHRTKRSQLKAFSTLVKKIEKRMLLVCSENRLHFEASVESGLSLLTEFLFRIIVKNDFTVTSEDMELYEDALEAICRMHICFREEASKSDRITPAQQKDLLPFLKVALIYLILNLYQREKVSVATNPIALRLEFPELHVCCIEGEFFVRSYLAMIPDLGETWPQHLNDCYELAARLPNEAAGKAAFDQALKVMKKNKPDSTLGIELDFGSHPLFGPCIVENVQGDKIKLRFSLGRTKIFKSRSPIHCKIT